MALYFMCSKTVMANSSHGPAKNTIKRDLLGSSQQVVLMLSANLYYIMYEHARLSVYQ